MFHYLNQNILMLFHILIIRKDQIVLFQAVLCSFQGTFTAISPLLGVKVRAKQLGMWNKPMKDENKGMTQEN